MTINNEAAAITKWTDKLRQEFRGFYQELDTEIKNYQRKTNHLTDITHQGVEIEAETKDINKLNKAFKSLTKVYLDLSSNLTKLSDTIDFNEQIEQKDLDTIKKNMRQFESELESISETIKDNFFKTKSEKFLLEVKSIFFEIINLITGKGYTRHIITEHNVILLDGPDSYYAPIKTLPERPKNSLFFTSQIEQELAQIERTIQLSFR
ncbi:hypothetical protein [Rickettsiella massiliensis]|uniref:hypothetical protein n=1 Tax=Rickettsiella massiliensis TaxID=676517 RepID=UPI00029B0B71|nr:hypothetical protein [Rickettsiella massiliensis]